MEDLAKKYDIPPVVFDGNPVIRFDPTVSYDDNLKANGVDPDEFADQIFELQAHVFRVRLRPFLEAIDGQTGGGGKDDEKLPEELKLDKLRFWNTPTFNTGMLVAGVTLTYLVYSGQVQVFLSAATGAGGVGLLLNRTKASDQLGDLVEKSSKQTAEEKPAAAAPADPNADKKKAEERLAELERLSRMGGIVGDLLERAGINPFKEMAIYNVLNQEAGAAFAIAQQNRERQMDLIRDNEQNYQFANPKPTMPVMPVKPAAASFFSFSRAKEETDATVVEGLKYDREKEEYDRKKEEYDRAYQPYKEELDKLNRSLFRQRREAMHEFNNKIREMNITLAKGVINPNFTEIVKTLTDGYVESAKAQVQELVAIRVAAAQKQKEAEQALLEESEAREKEIQLKIDRIKEEERIAQQKNDEAETKRKAEELEKAEKAKEEEKKQQAIHRGRVGYFARILAGGALAGFGAFMGAPAAATAAATAAAAAGAAALGALGAAANNIGTLNQDDPLVTSGAADAAQEAGPVVTAVQGAVDQKKKEGIEEARRIIIAQKIGRFDETNKAHENTLKQMFDAFQQSGPTSKDAGEVYNIMEVLLEKRKKLQENLVNTLAEASYLANTPQQKRTFAVNQDKQTKDFVEKELVQARVDIEELATEIKKKTPAATGLGESFTAGGRRNIRRSQYGGYGETSYKMDNGLLISLLTIGVHPFVIEKLIKNINIPVQAPPAEVPPAEVPPVEVPPPSGGKRVIKKRRGTYRKNVKRSIRRV